MLNVPQQNTIAQYQIANSQTEFTFAFYAPTAGDIQVYYQASNAIPVPASDILVLNTQYTVTFNSDPTTGGYITLLFTPTNGYILTINRQVIFDLDTNFGSAISFNGNNLDTQLINLLLMAQQNQNYILQRNLSYVINSYLPNPTPFLPNSNSNLQVPTLGQNQFWMGSGSGIIAATVAQVPSASVLQSALASETMGADGGSLVGYYDTFNSVPTTVSAFLNNLPSYLSAFTSSYSVDTGSANVYVATPQIPFTSYMAGQTIHLQIANTNTSTSCTLAVSGLAAKTIKLVNGTVPAVGALVAGMVAEFIYDGTYMQLINPAVTENPAIAASVYCSATHTVATMSGVTVLFDTAEFDPYGMFNSGSNTLTVPYAGKYRFSVILNVLTVTVNPQSYMGIDLYKNGVVWKQFAGCGSSGEVSALTGSVIVNCNAADAFYCQFFKTDGANSTYASANSSLSPQQCSSFQVEYIGT